MNRQEALEAIPNLQTKLSLAMNDLHQSLSRVRTMPDEKEFYPRYYADRNRCDDLQKEMTHLVEDLHPKNQPKSTKN